MYLVTAKTKATAQDFPGSTVEWAVGQTREVHDSLIQEFKNNPAAWTVSGGATTSTLAATSSAQGIVFDKDGRSAARKTSQLFDTIESIYTRLFVTGKKMPRAIERQKDLSSWGNDLFFAGGGLDSEFHLGDGKITVPGGAVSAGKGNKFLIGMPGATSWNLFNNESLLIQARISIPSASLVAGNLLFGNGGGAGTVNGWAIRVTDATHLEFVVWGGSALQKVVTIPTAIAADTTFDLQIFVRGNADTREYRPHCAIWISEARVVTGTSVSNNPNAMTTNVTASATASFCIGYSGEIALNTAATSVAINVYAMRVSVFPSTIDLPDTDKLASDFSADPYRKIPYFVSVEAENAPGFAPEAAPLFLSIGYGQSTETGNAFSGYNKTASPTTQIGGTSYSGSNLKQYAQVSNRPYTRRSTYLGMDSADSQFDYLADYIANVNGRKVVLSNQAEGSTSVLDDWVGWIKPIPAASASWRIGNYVMPGNGHIYKLTALSSGTTYSGDISGTTWPASGTVVTGAATWTEAGSDAGLAPGRVWQYGELGFDPALSKKWGPTESSIVWAKANGYEVWAYMSGWQSDYSATPANPTDKVIEATVLLVTRALAAGVAKVCIGRTFLGTAAYYATIRDGVLAAFAGDPRVIVGADLSGLSNENYTWDKIHQTDKGNRACGDALIAWAKNAGLAL